MINLWKNIFNDYHNNFHDSHHFFLYCSISYFCFCKANFKLEFWSFSNSICTCNLCCWTCFCCKIWLLNLFIYCKLCYNSNFNSFYFCLITSVIEFLFYFAAWRLWLMLSICRSHIRRTYSFLYCFLVYTELSLIFNSSISLLISSNFFIRI